MNKMDSIKKIYIYIYLKYNNKNIEDTIIII